MKKLLICLMLILPILGCQGNLSPLSPNNKNKIANQQGKIEEMKTNQDAIAAEIGKLRQDQQITARDMDKVQTGIANKQNTGVQIFQGDGAMMAIIVLVGIVMAAVVFIVHYRSEATKNGKTAEIMAMQIARFNNLKLEDNIFAAAMNTEVEKDVYHLLTKHQALLGRKGIR